MRNLSLFLGLALLISLSSSPNAFGSILPATLVGGTLNTYEDQSRESIVDVDGDGSLSEGDVIFGFLRIDDRAVPAPGSDVPDDDLYAVFTSEVDSISSVVIGAQTLYSASFIPTTVVGLRLTDLVSGLPALPAGTSPAAAVFEDVGANFITTAPVGATSMLDYFDIIDDGNLDLVAGFDPSAPTTDFWSSQALVFTAADPIANLSLFNSLTLSTPVGATFDAGLSVLYLDPSMPALDRLVPVSNVLAGTTTNHDTGITNGNTSGASDAVGASSFGGGFMSAGVTFDSDDVYPVADNANVSLFPVVPEPMSLLVWVGLIAVATGASNFRQRHRTIA